MFQKIFRRECMCVCVRVRENEITARFASSGAEKATKPKPLLIPSGFRIICNIYIHHKKAIMTKSRKLRELIVPKLDIQYLARSNCTKIRK